MIRVKGCFSNWTEVDPLQAYIICKQISDISGIPAVRKSEWINKHHLDGITFQELEKKVSEFLSKEVLR